MALIPILMVVQPQNKKLDVAEKPRDAFVQSFIKQLCVNCTKYWIQKAFE